MSTRSATIIRQTTYWGETGIRVGKYDSPNNPCSHLPKECDWSEA